jgi:hypothetical protein
MTVPKRCHASAIVNNEGWTPRTRTGAVYCNAWISARPGGSSQILH